MINIFKRVNKRTFLVFSIIFSILNSIIIPLINKDDITFPRIIIGIVVSVIFAFLTSLNVKTETTDKQ